MRRASLCVLIGLFCDVHASPPSCPAPLSPNSDVTDAQNCAAYPDGVSNVSLLACCSACASQPDCVGFVYDPAGKNCWPLAGYSGLVPATDRTYGGGPPPPPPPPVPPTPPPADWASKVAARDMLWTPNDSLIKPNNMPMIGNGFLATQVMSSSVFTAGIFSGYLTKDPSHRARLPATSAIAAPGAPGPAALDVREATYFRRSFLDPSPPGACTLASTASCSNAPGRITIEQRWYAHRSRPAVMVHEVQVLPGAGVGGAGVSGGSAAPFAMLLLINAPGAPSDDLALSPASPAPPGATLRCGSTRVAETNTSGLQQLCVATTDLPAGPLPVDAAAPTATHTLLTVVRTSVETPAGGLPGAVLAEYAAAAGAAAGGTLRGEHVVEWAETVWPAGFETDRADLALAVNTSLYAILSSVRNDRPFGLSPGGLTAGYNGHSFWDCETWMYPGVLLLHPDTAQTLLDYRTIRLPGARDKAASYAPPFGGAMFPWESALTGEETCPTWAATGLREVHINGDIAVAVWGMWRSLGGDNGGLFLNNTAWPLLSGIADFWMSKLALDNPGAAPGAPLSLLNVIPPDEYVDHVDNSAFTNHGAIQTLRYASAVAALMGQPPGRAAPWLDAAARIVRPFNASGPDGGWTPEYDGYKVGSKIKQADVILLGYPLEAEWVPPATRINNLHLYQNVTDSGGPAMTWGMFAVGYIELGPQFAAAAAANFNRSFANAQPPFLVWTETPGGGTPNFLTGAGGFLQTAFNGYPGLRVNDTAMALLPQLPQGAATLKLRGVAYLGNRLDISYDAAAVTVALQRAPSRATAGGRRGACAACMRPAGEPAQWRSQAGRVVMGGGEREVAQRPLAVVDAAGAARPLTVGAPVTLPLQAIAIVGT